MHKGPEAEEPFTVEMLCMAYANGVFPMPEPVHGKEILWYRPDPRAILPLEGFHCSRSLQKTIRQKKFSVTFDQAFGDVMRHCADRPDTWINDLFLETYGEMFERGLAHSVEVWRDGKLAGGLYGVCLRGAFFAESKFHKFRDASKVALFHLVEHLNAQGFGLLEVQFLTPHLERLGAIAIPHAQYMRKLKTALELSVEF